MERLERALAVISYAILQDGPVYAPVLERLEREIAAHRSKGRCRFPRAALSGSVPRSGCRSQRQGEGNSLKILQLEPQAVSVAVFRLVDGVPHHQAVLCLDPNERDIGAEHDSILGQVDDL